MVTKAVERLYDDTAIIRTFDNSQIDDNGKIHQTVTELTAQPCRLSYKNVPVAGGEGVTTAEQSITLFISATIDVKAGSEIIIKRNGKDLHFTAAGAPALYQSHQEIPLKFKVVHNG